MISNIRWLWNHWILMLAGFILTFAEFTVTIQRWGFGQFWLPISFAIAFAGFSVLTANFFYTKTCKEIGRRGQYLISLRTGIIGAIVLSFSVYTLGFLIFTLLFVCWLIVFIGIFYFGYRIWKSDAHE